MNGHSETKSTTNREGCQNVKGQDARRLQARAGTVPQPLLQSVPTAKTSSRSRISVSLPALEPLALKMALTFICIAIGGASS
ncbi:hypothetical protein J6590_044114 [Homalodisca vitripennis]|nr:hypothetical protein J6590_044114 [Homalodisca vitripennis]